MSYRSTLLGRHIKEARVAASITQPNLAEMIGIDSTAMSQIENGRRYISAAVLGTIARLIGADHGEMLRVAEQGEKVNA